MNPLRYLVFIFLLLTFIPGCGSNEKGSSVIIGIPFDPESLNPLYAFSGYEIAITEILYPSMVKLDWDQDKGDISVSLMMADEVTWGKDLVSATVTLKKGIYWSDSVEVTSDDFIFSFDLYSDPAVQSRLYGGFSNYSVNDSMRILSSSFEKLDIHTFRINFRPGSNPSLIDLDLPVVPKHVYSRYERRKIPEIEKEIRTVTCGPYSVKSWNRNQSIILSKNKSSFLASETSPEEIIFKVVPDYNSRITQLKNGEIDFADDIRTEDVKELESYESLSVGFVKGREYDYIGWNNVNPTGVRRGSSARNILFGESVIRKALTYAVNRFEIMKEYLQDYGEVASSSLSPIFREAVDPKINPYPYDPGRAKELLKQEGWNDTDNDGILEKGGHEFSFTLNIPSGNPRREFASVIIKNNLRQVGINVTVEPMEPAVFFEKMFKRELNAWIAGWSIPIPQDIRTYWHSNFKEAPFNVTSFSSSRADGVINKIVKEKDPTVKNQLFREMHRVMYDEVPVTFLYWIDNVVVYNSRIKNAAITPLGAVHNVWEWEINE